MYTSIDVAVWLPSDNKKKRNYHWYTTKKRGERVQLLKSLEKLLEWKRTLEGKAASMRKRKEKIIFFVADVFFGDGGRASSTAIALHKDASM